MWGAAIHDRSTGIHRPLEAGMLWLQPDDPAQGQPRLIVSLDHCILDPVEMDQIRASIERRAHIDRCHVLICLTHTHGSGWMSRDRSPLPGGDLIGPYLDHLADQLGRLAGELRDRLQPATIQYVTGRCNLAAHRDYFDEAAGRYVCGLNPSGPADDTLLVGRVCAADQTIMAVLVNYACHPTTLAWDNTLLSPDWVGAMREVVRQTTGADCLYLQGASGDLGPREGFVGDIAVADRNGRQVGYAVLSALESIPPVGTDFCYTGSVTSGTEIGIWSHRPHSQAEERSQSVWKWHHFTVDLPYRHDLPEMSQAISQRDHWQAEQAQALADGDHARYQDCRAQVEQRTRQIARLDALVPGKCYPLPIVIGLTGEAVWIFAPGELYQTFQITLRERFPDRTLVVATLCGNWQPGYIPSATTYGYGIYQEQIAATEVGSLEWLIEEVTRHLRRMFASEDALT
jgi:hypothetical protein